jgi:hypothetical protein
MSESWQTGLLVLWLAALVARGLREGLSSLPQVDEKALMAQVNAATAQLKSEAKRHRPGAKGR